MRRPETLPEAVIEEIKSLRAQGMAMEKIAGLVMTTRHMVRRALDPKLQYRITARGDGSYFYRQPPPPQEVIDERERAYGGYSVLSALLGDPPPGRSALDRLKKC